MESRWKPEELGEIRTSLERGSPFGEKAWAQAAAKRLGLELTLRPPGRPKAAKLSNMQDVNVLL